MNIGIWVYLRKGHSTLVDYSDYLRISGFQFSLNQQYLKSGVYNRCYIVINRQKKLLHRFILNVSDSSMHVDHIDNDPLNNTRENLRVCDASQNNFNRKFFNSKENLKSIFFSKEKHKYYFEIQKQDLKIRSKGYFSKKICYLDSFKMTSELHGDFHNYRELSKYELEKIIPKKATKQKGSKTRYVGVFCMKKGQKGYRMQIQNNGKSLSFFGFKTQKEAAKKYDEIMFKLNGYDGLFNFPEDYTVFL